MYRHAFSWYLPPIARKGWRLRLKEQLRFNFGRNQLYRTRAYTFRSGFFDNQKEKYLLPTRRSRRSRVLGGMIRQINATLSRNYRYLEIGCDSRYPVWRVNDRACTLELKSKKLNPRLAPRASSCIIISIVVVANAKFRLDIYRALSIAKTDRKASITLRRYHIRTYVRNGAISPWCLMYKFA